MRAEKPPEARRFPKPAQGGPRTRGPAQTRGGAAQGHPLLGGKLLGGKAAARPSSSSSSLTDSRVGAKGGARHQEGPGVRAAALAGKASPAKLASGASIRESEEQAGGTPPTPPPTPLSDTKGEVQTPRGCSLLNTLGPEKTAGEGSSQAAPPPLTPSRGST